MSTAGFSISQYKVTLIRLVSPLPFHVHGAGAGDDDGAGDGVGDGHGDGHGHGGTRQEALLC